MPGKESKRTTVAPFCCRRPKQLSVGHFVDWNLQKNVHNKTHTKGVDRWLGTRVNIFSALAIEIPQPWTEASRWCINYAENFSSKSYL